MNLKYSLAVLCSMAVLAGAAGCRSTNDPAVKLLWASEMFSSQDDPVPAEELIADAIELYTKQKNDLGLAEAYRQYALFLRSNAVYKFRKHFQEEGFLDKSVRFETRYAKAAEYFIRSKDLFADYGRTDDLSNLYLSLAKTYDLMGKQPEACDSLVKGRESYEEFKKTNPEVKEFRSEETANYVEYIGLLNKQMGCLKEGS